MRYGARNVIEAEVTEIKEGGIMGQVKLKVPAEALMCSVMTRESIEELGLGVGDRVQVIVKAINVLVAKES